MTTPATAMSTIAATMKLIMEMPLFIRLWSDNQHDTAVLGYPPNSNRAQAALLLTPVGARLAREFVLIPERKEDLHDIGIEFIQRLRA